MATGKDNTAHIGIMVGVIGTVIGLLGTVAGLAQLEPVRAFSCEQASVLCKREYELKLFKMTYIPAAPGVANHRPWDMAIEYPSVLFGSRKSTDCISPDQLSEFLNRRGAVMDGGKYVVTVRDKNTVGQWKWVFDPTPLSLGKAVPLSANDDLVFYLSARYIPLARDVTLSMDATISDGYQLLPRYTVDRTFDLRKGSRQYNAFCKLFLPYESSTFHARFEFKDDVWTRDDPLKIVVSVEVAQAGAGK